MTIKTRPSTGLGSCDNKELTDHFKSKLTGENLQRNLTDDDLLKHITDDDLQMNLTGGPLKKPN